MHTPSSPRNDLNQQRVHADNGHGSAKAVLIFVIVVILIIGGVIGYAVGKRVAAPANNQDSDSGISRTGSISTPVPSPSPVPNVPDDWMNYTNPHWNYTISYPADWELETGAEILDDGIRILHPTDTAGIFSVDYFGTAADAPSNPTVTINETTLYHQLQEKDSNYYVRIPDTDTYLRITFPTSATVSQETYDTMQRMLESFTINFPVQEE